MSEKAPDHAGIRVPPPLILLGLVLVGPLLDRLLGFGQVALSRPVHVVLVLALIGAGLAVALAAVRRFARAGTRVEPWAPSSAIVSDGVYGFTRNPMYVGMVLVMFGLALIICSPSSLLLVGLGLIILDRFVVRREEAYLEAKFGDAYRDYRARVRRWL